MILLGTACVYVTQRTLDGGKVMEGSERTFSISLSMGPVAYSCQVGGGRGEPLSGKIGHGTLTP